MQPVDKEAVRAATAVVRDSAYRVKRSGHVKDLQRFVSACVNLANAKGWKEGYGDNIMGDCRDSSSLIIRVIVMDHDYNSRHLSSSMRTLEDEGALDTLIDRLAQEVIDLPNIDDHARAKWREALAGLVASGEDLGVGMEYVEMLKATAEKLATNVLGPSTIWTHDNDLNPVQVPKR